MSRRDRATVLRINSVGAVGAQVAPGRVVFEHRAEDHEQRAHAGGERANTRVGQAASTDVGTTGREMLGAHSQHRFRSPHARPSQRLPPFPSFRHSHPSAIPILPPFLRPLPSTRPPNRATSLHPPFPSFRHSCAPSVIPSAIPAPPPSFLRRQESMRPPNRATSLHPPFPSFRHSRPLRHSCAPSVIPAEAGIHATAQPCDEPPSAIPILPPFLRPLRHSCDRPTVRHSCAPSVIPAIHATAQPCDEPPSAIPILPPFPSLRHSCAPSVIPAEAGIHATAHSCAPSVIPAVRRASIRPTAHQSPQRAAGDRAPSNIGSALDPTDRMDSCLRRNDGQAGVTEGRRSDRAAPEPARTYKGGSRRSPR